MPKKYSSFFVCLFLATVGFASSATSPVVPEKAALSAFAQLQAVQVRYQSIVQSGGWPAWELGAAIKPNVADKRVGTLRAILYATGDLPEGNSPETATYNEPLQEAVKKFQARHALKADGAIGKDTQAALAVSAAQRLAEITATLERMQQTPAPESDRYILVNIPGFYLQAMEHGRVALTSRVIVGTPDNATPLMARAITDVNFNPPWHVPSRIAAQELSAREENNPGYLQRSGFTLTDAEGNTVSAEEVDWSNTRAYRFRQRPGAGNALGKIKFNFPNDHAVYLHSTAKPQLFSQDFRALSHGCVRVERTRELAQFVIRDTQGLNEDAINRLYDSSTTRTVRLLQPVPVHLVYWPAWVQPESGEVHFHPDIYRKIATRVAELMKNGEFKVAMQ